MLDLVGLRVDHLVIDRCPQQVKQMREDNHQPRQDEENHRGMRDLVPDPFNAGASAEMFLVFRPFPLRTQYTSAPSYLQTPLRELQSKNGVVFASGRICSKSTAEFLLEVSIGLARCGGWAAGLGGD